MRQRLLAKRSLVFISLIITTAAAFSSESPFLKRSGRNLVDNTNEEKGQKKYNKGFSSSSSSLHVANGRRGGSDNTKNEKDLSEKQKSSSSSSSSSSILLSPVVQFIGLLFRGVTLPFPTLRRLVEKQPSEAAKEDGGFSIQESVLAILVYLGLGAVAYHSSIQEWSFVDALYFSVVTFTTVGYGDLAPTTAVGKIFTIMFGLSGITVLGIAIGTIGNRLLQNENEFLKMAEEASRKRIMGLFNSLVTEQQQQKTNSGTTLDTTTTAAATNQEEVKPSSVWRKSFEMLINKSIPAMSILLFGGIYMGRLEGWSIIDSIYYSFITAATLGYGDFSPISRPGRVWAIIFIPLAVAAAGEVLGNIASFLSDRRRQRFYQSLMDRELNAETLIEMDDDHNGKVSREEYVQFMLKEMQLVDDEVFQDLHEQFKKLDIDGGGYLDKKDLKLKLQQQKADKANNQK